MADENNVNGRRPVTIDPGPRILAGGAGIALLIAGTTATFTRKVEAGPVALIAAGVLFALIGLAGVMPTRLKWGDKEAEWSEAAAEALADIAQLVPANNRDQALAALGELAEIAPQSAGPAMRAYAYEQLVMQMIQRTIEFANKDRDPGNLLVITVQSRSNNFQYDAKVSAPSMQGGLAIEVKSLSHPVDTRTLASLRGLLLGSAKISDIRHVLVVSRTGFTADARNRLREDEGPLKGIAVSGLDDEAALHRTVLSLISE